MLDSNIDIEDRVLLEKAAVQGCSESLAAIYIKYQSAVCDFLRKSGAGDTAEDICHLVFLEIHEGRCKYNGSSETKTFLFGVAGNLHKYHLRKSGTGIGCLSLEQVQPESAQNSTKEDQLERFQTAEIREFLINQIAELPKNAAQAIRMVYLDGIPSVKAAEMIGVDFKVFCGRLNYGLRKLKKNKKISTLKSLFCNMLCVSVKIF